jgi:DMSO reductase anchor subunit
MLSHWSLVAFTLLVQSAAGSIWCTQAASIMHSGSQSVSSLTFHVFAALVAALAGMAAAVGHLGHPMASFHAIKNLKRSWLSRESVAVNIFAGVLAAIVVVSLTPSDSAFDFILVLGSIAAMIALYAMICVYRLRTVPSWNHAGTAFAFLGSALLLGGLLFILVSILDPHVTWQSLTVMQKPSYVAIGLCSIVAGYMLKIAGLIVIPPTRVDIAKGLGTSATVAHLFGGVAFVALLGLTEAGPILQRAFLFLASAGLVTGEIVHRIRFYAAYQRVGL